MALNYKELSSLAASYINSVSVDKYLGVGYLDNIRSYLESNCEVYFMYTGVTPQGTPDPKNGKTVAKLNLTGLGAKSNTLSFVEMRESPNPNAFVEAIIADCTGEVILKDSGFQGIGSLQVYSAVSTVNGIEKKSDYKECWDMIANAIVESVITMKPTDISTITTSGVGISKFIEAL